MYLSVIIVKLMLISWICITIDRMLGFLLELLHYSNTAGVFASSMVFLMDYYSLQNLHMHTHNFDSSNSTRIHH